MKVVYIGVEADPVKLNKVQEMVLGLNNPDAFLKLASQYYTGDGVKKDKKKAFEYYMIKTSMIIFKFLGLK